MLYVDLDILMTRQPTQRCGCGEGAAAKKIRQGGPVTGNQARSLIRFRRLAFEAIQAFRRGSMSARNASNSLRAAVSAERSIFR